MKGISNSPPMCLLFTAKYEFRSKVAPAARYATIRGLPSHAVLGGYKYRLTSINRRINGVVAVSGSKLVHSYLSTTQGATPRAYNINKLTCSAQIRFIT